MVQFIITCTTDSCSNNTLLSLAKSGQIRMIQCRGHLDKSSEFEVLESVLP